MTMGLVATELGFRAFRDPTGSVFLRYFAVRREKTLANDRILLHMVA